MDLRPELLPPPVAPERLAELAREIERIGDLLYRGEPAAEAVAGFNRATGHDYEASDFAEYHAWRTLEDFAKEAARPAWPRVSGLTRDELAEIVRRLRAADPESDHYLRLLRACVTHPAASDLIFTPPPGLEAASPEEIADRILAHRPIAL
ncbi:hypothetical protein [Actinomadura viridis]|uniref:Uncharacterized protein n=1 Tax=Actinomadura viridis TaxID=58110 RepID=A0A931DT17_9ACTN|nr:hypothetical protein [Actinomadura viridis]MBG6093402.1 hypothetical protein [Actinomadura viridis]